MGNEGTTCLVTPWLLYFSEKRPWYAWNREFYGPQINLDSMEKRKYLLQQRTEPQFTSCPACSAFTKINDLLC